MLFTGREELGSNGAAVSAAVTTEGLSSGSRGDLGMWVVELGLELRRVHFSSVRNLLSRIPWKVSRMGRRLIFKEKIERAQEQTIMLCRKTGCCSRRPAW